jgi:conjugal transfer pilus assembly protein TraE
MEFAALDRSVRTARRGRNLAVVLLVTMIGANALLGLRLLNQSNQVVLIPTQVSDGMVARGAVDKRYVEALALDAVYAMYNATPETLDYGRQVLDRLSSLRERSAILDQYDRIATDMRERKISTVFFPEKLEHNYDRRRAAMAGSPPIARTGWWRRSGPHRRGRRGGCCANRSSMPRGCARSGSSAGRLARARPPG